VAIVAVADPADSPRAETIDALNGIPTIAVGLALVVAGGGAVHGGSLSAPRWLLLLTIPARTQGGLVGSRHGS
jgi:hypothetical protein